METLLFVLLLLVIIGLISGTFMFWVPEQHKSIGSTENLPFISIIIPARDEEKRLPNLLKSLNQQEYKAYEVIVVDDGSVDDTISVARSYGASAIKNQAVENMTAGKARACATGAEHAKGEWLLFLDADVQFKNKDSLGNLLATFQRKGAEGIFSVQPYHEIKHTYENLSAIFNVIVVTGVNVFTFWKDKLKTAGSFGPVILTTKEDYERTGGHNQAPESIMDDFALSSIYLEQDLPVINYAGKGLITLRMYPEGIKQLVEGWTKNLATASQSTHWFVMLLIMMWINGAFMAVLFPLLSLFIGETTWILLGGAFYFVYAFHVLVLARRTGNFHAWIFLLFPILFLFFTAIFVYSLYCTHILRSVSWKGRKIKV
ncbi:glycosyltransferase family 2 protein [Oceanobacillus sp. CAU 1775]